MAANTGQKTVIRAGTARSMLNMFACVRSTEKSRAISML